MFKQILRYGSWFIPLALGFIAVAIFVNDLRHPQVTSRACHIVALGPAVPQQLKRALPMYSTGRGPQHHIGLSCVMSSVHPKQNEMLWVNDETPFAYGQIALGDTVTLREIRYRFLPVQHRLTVNTSAKQ